MRKLKVKLPYKSLEDIYLKESFARHIPLLPRETVLYEQPASNAAAQPEQQDQSIQQTQPNAPASTATASARAKPVKRERPSVACSSIDKPDIEITPSKEFNALANRATFSVKWTDYQRNLFDKVKPGVKRGTGGTGRGEYSIASFVSGIPSKDTLLAPEEIICLLDSCISGQGKSYDVCIPPEMPEYESKHKLKFEVKQLKMNGSSVMIGAEGTKATSQIVDGIMDLMIRLENSYKSLSNVDKNTLNSRLRMSLSLEQENSTWTLGGFISAIYQKEEEEGRTIRELPSSLIKKEGKINPRLFGKNALRAQYFYRTLQEVFNAIEQIAANSDKYVVAATSRTAQLRDMVRNLYLPELQDANQIKKEEEYLDKYIDKLDRDLTRRKITTVGTGHLTLKEFLGSMNRLKLLSSLREIQNMFNDPKIIRSLFPEKFDGLFLVQEDSFSYIPHDQIFNYIEIDSISNGGAKIAFKKQ